LILEVGSYLVSTADSGFGVVCGRLYFIVFFAVTGVSYVLPAIFKGDDSLSHVSARFSMVASAMRFLVSAFTPAFASASSPRCVVTMTPPSTAASAAGSRCPARCACSTT